MTNNHKLDTTGLEVFYYQVDVLNEWHSDDLLVMICVDEVDVIGKPADREDDDHNHEHLDDLIIEVKN